MSAKYEIREIAEESHQGAEQVPVLGADGRPKLDEKGREVFESKDVTVRRHSVLYVVMDDKGKARPDRIDLALSDADTLADARKKADDAVRSKLGL